MNSLRTPLLAITAGFVVLVASSPANAVLIEYKTRATDSAVINTNYKDSWDNQGSPINVDTLSDFTLVQAPGNYHHSWLHIEFDVSSKYAGANWAFQFGLDAGLGGDVFLNGALIERDPDDLWWNFSWNDPDMILGGSSVNVAAGSHTLDAYWAEDCCNGAQSARFSTNGDQNWMAVSTDNLEAVAVSEPAVLGLLGIGLAGIGFATKKKA